ncbi:acyltransferase family protein [Sandaracinobacteroides saxicola]|uniref:Acyltransferase n=1 Tax=Sandaracinobacteroides saxicola TaxID=2759707 RepID=A0A7G5IH43_9SPHN|nr:acyltransferase [Sandaracinobacteroides saxicola]QMW22685.1 acyltransferase [Sandaracinobacteroides saxicola]
MRSFEARLAEYSGFGPGFDFVRLFLASGVVLWHCFPLTTGTPQLIEATPLWFFLSAMVPLFFVVSGYLVTASANRLEVGPYLMNRAARIVPALSIVVVVSALLLGPLVSSLPVDRYFTDGMVARYLLNIMGIPGFLLPGVFEANPLKGVVNGSLWTVPHEFLSYAMMAVLMLLGLAKRWWSVGAIFAGLTLLAFARVLLPAGTLPGPLDAVIQSNHFAQGSKIIPYFLLGALIYLLRDRIPYDGRLAALAMIYLVGVGFVVPPDARHEPMLWLLSGPPLAYLVVWAGLTPLPALTIAGRGNDYSYGIYLWHFPILQLLVMAFGFTHWGMLALVAVPIVLAVAMLSWHLVEKPVMRWRKRYSLMGAHVAAESR